MTRAANEALFLRSDELRVALEARNRRSQKYRVFRVSDGATLGWCPCVEKAEELVAALGEIARYE